nr:hypothetical protein [Halobellus captivus]
MLKSTPDGSYPFPEVPQEVTNWISEQRAWRNTCALANQSHHMTDIWIQGPDALALLSNLGINSFDNFEKWQAKQFVACNSDGYVIGDAVLCYLDDNDFLLTGAPAALNWVQYNAKEMNYDVSIERDDNSHVREGPPKNFRYQIQGPNALEVMKKVTDSPLPEVSFFNFTEFSINGIDFYGLRHSMAGEAGFEIWGPWEDNDEIRVAILEAGEEYGIQELGSKSYASSSVILGWVGSPLPAIYSEGLESYREWLDADSPEAKWSLGGSYDSEEIEDYYVTPMEIGYTKLISLDHDFIGRESLEQKVENPNRTLVTLEWDPADATKIYRSLFEEKSTYKYMDLPVIPWAIEHNDKVVDGGDLIGLSKKACYIVNERRILSLCCINEEYSQEGTEVSIVWGDSSNSPSVESHTETEISATVSPVPYSADNR